MTLIDPDEVWWLWVRDFTGLVSKMAAGVYDVDISNRLRLTAKKYGWPFSRGANGWTGATISPQKTGKKGERVTLTSNVWGGWFTSAKNKHGPQKGRECGSGTLQ
jgi:hypothetical protein